MLSTSKGKTYEVMFADLAVVTSGNLMIKMHDNRRLPEIAAEFDGLEWLRNEREGHETKEFVAYSDLKEISRMNDGAVLLTLAKGGNA